MTALSIACPTCAAKPGEECVVIAPTVAAYVARNTGQNRGGPHAMRVYALQARNRQTGTIR